ncbi:MAG: type II secretion system minor pseudopilin GspH [Gammaproteobacteria bacterium]|nr:type II secretion system minor pseudopilin GspH [Gammaproteobacteria bacterium]
MIEVLVVILIIGIIINFAVISLDIHKPSDTLKTEARRLTSLIELASEEALLRSQLIGIAIDENSYEFLTFDEDQWRPVDDAVFRTRTLPDDIRLELLTEQSTEDANQTETKKPGIVLMTSGESTAFELKISSDLIDNYYRISGAETGTLELDHVENY